MTSMEGTHDAECFKTHKAFYAPSHKGPPGPLSNTGHHYMGGRLWGCPLGAVASQQGWVNHHGVRPQA